MSCFIPITSSTSFFTLRQKEAKTSDTYTFPMNGQSSPLQYVWVPRQLHDTKRQLIGCRLLPWNVASHKINQKRAKPFTFSSSICRISFKKEWRPAGSPAMKNVTKLSSMNSSSSWVIISSGTFKQNQWVRVILVFLSSPLSFPCSVVPRKWGGDQHWR